MSTTGRAPALAIPAAKATAWLSQIPTSKNRSGKVSRIFWSLFPSHIAAVSTATLGSRCMAANRAALTASVYALLDEVLSGMIPSSAVWNGAGAWYLTGSFTAGSNPCPLSVRTWSRTGPSIALTFSR